MDQPADFRYLIVGGGSAGCLLAARLADAQAGPVAVIEAGANNADVRSRVPAWYPKLFGSRSDWSFRTSPQAALAKRQLAWPRGKLLGGSGAINALIYLLAPEEDWHRWGWPAHSGRAPLPLAPVATPHPWTLLFLRSLGGLGCRLLEPFEYAANGCGGTFLLTQQSGRRTHTGQLLDTNSLNQTADPLSTVYLQTESSVQRIVLEGQRATGVIVRDKAGQTRRLRCSQEVILCGGAIGSPELLLKSGIGPRDELREAKVDCHTDLPWVGRNLQDHLVFPMVYQVRASASGSGLVRRYDRTSRDRYRREGNGPLASNIAEAGAVLPLGSDGATFQIHFTPTHYLKYPLVDTNRDHFSLALTDLHPASRGFVRLAPSTLAHHDQATTCIDPNYFSARSDLERYLSAVEMAESRLTDTPLGDIAERLILPLRRTGPALEKAIRALAQTIYHPVGTCRAGRSGGDSVVDHTFRVHQLQGLRVVDASVFPDLPGANPNASVHWLAELAARHLVD